MFSLRSRLLTDCFELYLADCTARGQAARTIEGKRVNLGFFVRWCHSMKLTRVRQINRVHLEQYRLTVSRHIQPGIDQPLQINSQRNRLTAVKTFFRLMSYYGLVVQSPTKGFELPKVIRKLPNHVLCEQEVELILSSIPKSPLWLRNRAIFETFYATGIRRMELAMLNLADIDFSGRVLSINQGKGSRDRRLPIAERACYWIKRYINELRQPSDRTPVPTRALFLTRGGNRFRVEHLSRLGAATVRQSGIRAGGSCHLFRHAAATLMHKNGCDIRFVQRLLGHASISSTQLYVHVAENDLRHIYDRTHPAALNRCFIKK